MRAGGEARRNVGIQQSSEKRNHISILQNRRLMDLTRGLRASSCAERLPTPCAAWEGSI